CHGWEHALGTIASTIESLKIIDANGDLRILSKEKDPELFGCMFGTMGYFGIIVSATLRLSDNVELEEKAELCPIEEFHNKYTKEIKDNPDKPLLIGRLNVNRNPLQTLYINTFETTEHKERLITSGLKFESARGRTAERIFLAALGHLPDYIYTKLSDVFWEREVRIMAKEHRVASRNEIMHFGIKSFFQLHQSNLYTQWLQEFFIAEENLSDFLKYLGETLERNEVRLLNASIRPTPKDEISILPYAEKNRYAIVISFHQLKTKKQIEKTQKWIEEVQGYLLEKGDKWYQAYMPYATQEQFERCYGIETVDKMRKLKKKYDPDNLFSNRHTVKYF
ncbi:MAG: BBE domain-containing protein, partial [Verrucomicrobia bacterium]|nr:BBE domain-containing protein [Verrucomicrobiota bacterium]